VFKFIERQGKVDHDEMYRVFNMGIGFVLIVPKASLPAIKTIFRSIRQPWHQIGVIRKGKGVVTYKD
jgi:phosphoribosylformylglycinamidine cyclo-ligase